MRKIGELKGKPIVEGNPNEVKNNQIHAKTEGENITLSERKNGSLETISGSSSGGGSSEEIKYLYVCFNITATVQNRDSILPYLGNSQIVEYKGKQGLAGIIVPISMSNPYSMAGTTPPQCAKIVKGIIVQKGKTYDCTSFDKLIQNEGVDSSKFYEITEEEYNNYK